MTNFERWSFLFLKIGVLLFVLGWAEHAVRAMAWQEAADAVNEHERWHDDHGAPEGGSDD